VQWSYLRHLLRLYRFRYRGLIEFAQFCLVGFSGIFVDLGVVMACKELLALDTRVCAAAGFAVAVTSNYLLNRFWTFGASRDTPWLRSYAVFVGVCSLGLLVRLLIIHGLIELAGLDTGRWYLVTNTAGILAATGVNFLGSKYLAFSPSRLAFGRKPDRGN
jgi:putative flippase GtrA